MRQIYLLWVALCLCASLCLAQAPSTSQPLIIMAEKLVLDNSNNVAIFTGSVHAVQAEMDIMADRLRILYVNNKINKQANINQSVRLESANISKLIAEGNVVLKTPKYNARSGVGEYNVLKQQMLLTNNVVVEQNGHTASGARFLYDHKQQKGRIIGEHKENTQHNKSNNEGIKRNDHRPKLVINMGKRSG